MPVPPPPPAPQAGASDSLATQEREFFRDRPEMPELAASRRKHLALVDGLRDAMFWGARLLVRVVALLLIAGVIVWWWHLVAPEKLRWLTADESSHLQGLLLSGAISALVTAVGTKALGPS
jgi:hypothetical protein